ncbi:hypothetical protein NEMIN01_0891 [Nematocida minor]|uniref:uncharacterized protein n=1 Tax=Nematocida minor TaxID=1912983 RepID=UPI00221E8ED5|nr:uncharacterized protein NEMIN01_0891 [Nematocida minor]KAI5190192.1 hypothetical protein NEMIN01_0891 [Nematocida minor]
MQSRLELRITTEKNKILKEALAGLVEGITLEEEGSELVIKLEESGRLIKNAHIVVSYTNYVLKTINELAQLEEKEKQRKE